MFNPVAKHIHKVKKNISTPEYLKILVLRTVGNFLLLTSIFIIAKTFAQPVYEEARFFIDSLTGRKYIIADDVSKYDKDFTSPENRGRLYEFLKNRNIEIISPADADFSIVIPKINANSKIIDNVDAADQNAYLAALKTGVAHAFGTAFPGQGGHIYLFAHSTDYFWNVGTYNAVFYLLYKLEVNDEVNLFYQGRRFVYRIIDKKIVEPDEVDYLTRQTDNEFLTLQTCWPPGTTLKRLLMFAERVVE